jgi:hypothetical protein
MEEKFSYLKNFKLVSKYVVAKTRQLIAKMQTDDDRVKDCLTWSCAAK